MHLHRGDSDGEMFIAKYHTDKYGVVVLQQILNIINPSNTNDRHTGKIPHSQSYPRSNLEW